MAEHDSEMVKLFKRWRESGQPLEQFCENLEQLRALKAFIKSAARGSRGRGDASGTRSDVPSMSGTGPLPRSLTGYRLVREISRGGQAVVYEGVFLKTGRTVAVKIMRDGPLASESSRTRFNREVQILAALNHPNIVTVLDRGTADDGSEYFAMEYIAGESLDGALWNLPERRAAATPDDAAQGLKLFLKICDAVNAAHLRGIIHRDLKPSNIRVDERGEPHVLDFGLARSALQLEGSGSEPMTITGQFLGSLPWASPEQAEGAHEKIDTRTDIYSLGVILYQLVTMGQFPYQVVGSMRDVLNNIITSDPSPPSTILASREVRDLKRQAKRRPPAKKLLNPVMDAIVLKALSKRREDRYQNAGDLARDIENYLAGRPTVASGTARGGKRWWIPASAAAIVAVAAGMAAAMMLWPRAAATVTHGSESAPATVALTQPMPAPVAQSSPASGAMASAPAIPAGSQPAATLVAGPVATAPRPVPAAAAQAFQDPVDTEDYRAIWNALGMKNLRMHASSTDPKTFVEANANQLLGTLPDVMKMKDGSRVTTPAQWERRRTEIIEDFEREVYGRIPANVPKVSWRVTSTTQGSINGTPVINRTLTGEADNSAYPSVKVNIQFSFTVPASADRPVPILVMLGNNGGASLGSQALQNGWGYGTLNPDSIQRDTKTSLSDGIIGLTAQGKPRKLDDWGAYRAWQWGISRLIDFFEQHPELKVDAAKVGVAGSQGFGAAALVAEAFEPRVAVSLANSSGKCGAALLRRTYGRSIENIAGGEYYMVAGNFVKYGGESESGIRSAADIPVDMHELIALCAPRPCLISYPYSPNTDWWDKRGGFLAGTLAGPVYTLLGKQDFGVSGNLVTMPLPGNGTFLGGELAWRTYNGRNTELDLGWSQFFNWASAYVH